MVTETYEHDRKYASAFYDTIHGKADLVSVQGITRHCIWATPDYTEIAKTNMQNEVWRDLEIT